MPEMRSNQVVYIMQSSCSSRDIFAIIHRCWVASLARIHVVLRKVEEVKRMNLKTDGAEPEAVVPIYSNEPMG